MHALLALDTSTQLCSVALTFNGEVSEELVDIPRGHTQHILPAIKKLLCLRGLGLNCLDAIALTAGPGSFTGLRIGMGVAQGLAFGADLPVIPISTLQTLAQGSVRSGEIPHNHLIIPMLDARMKDVYWGIYRNEYSDEKRTLNPGDAEGICREIIPDQVNQPVLVLGKLNQIRAEAGSTVFDALSTEQINKARGVGDGWCFESELGFKPIHINSEARPLARDIIPLALEKLSRGEVLKPEALEPFYIRDKIHWQKRKRLR